MSTIDQIETIAQKLSLFLDTLNEIKPNRLLPLLLLLKENRPIAFSEIKHLLKDQYSSPDLAYHIRTLEKANIIRNQRMLDTTTGKARSSFYTLTDEGKWVVDALLALAEKWRKKLQIGKEEVK